MKDKEADRRYFESVFNFMEEILERSKEIHYAIVSYPTQNMTVEKDENLPI